MNPAWLAVFTGICLAWYKTGQLVNEIGHKFASPELRWLPESRETARPANPPKFEPAGFYSIPAMWEPRPDSTEASR